MQNLWSQAEANALTNASENADVALCVYASRLLGTNPKLVLHGGGNTSVKTKHTNLFGDELNTICVKGSGWDLATIEAAGLPALRLEPLLRLRQLSSLSDEDMVQYQRAQLLDPHAPNPSIETLLHAFLPHKHIYHTHANAVLSITNQPNGADICRDIFGDTMALVPYIKPGYDLAKSAADVFEANPSCKGLILLNHGIFTFNDNAKTAYSLMIDAITEIETYFEKNQNNKHSLRTVKAQYTAEAVTPMIRGAMSVETHPHHYKRMLVAFHTNDLVQKYVNGRNLASYSQQGVVTPDHIIRTKNLPLILPMNKDEIAQAIASYVNQYHQYFEKHNAQQKQSKVELDPFPRVLLAPGLGLFVCGKNAKELQINADIAQATMETILNAEQIGKYTALPEAELFEMEYWSLEQAKIAKHREQPLSRNVVVVTGAAGTIGTATAKAFAAQGAEVVLIDREITKCQTIADDIGPDAFALHCDITNTNDVKLAFNKICHQFGGVDIIVFNAGQAFSGKIGEVSSDILRQSFEINFFAHQSIAQQAIAIMKKQNTGGKLLFNVSKQALNPGLDFGPYGIAKSALLALVRQYAIDYADAGIQANAVNADRIRSGLLNEKMIDQRATARGLSKQAYMCGNLLKREVLAEDVAKAFVHQALSDKTTACITTVDGGNIAAAVR